VLRLAERIDEYNRTRRSAGEPVMTQDRLAGLSGVNPATVSRHINNHTQPSAAIAIAYAHALGVKVEDLFR
jgi:DNA-binding XRE family transcriptional regulator